MTVTQEHQAPVAETPAVAAELRAENLVRYYGKWRVVNDVTIEVRRGEVVGLLGPNGAGKTTSFYMIVGLLRPNHGRILLEGERHHRRAGVPAGASRARLPGAGAQHLPPPHGARERAGGARDHEADVAASARSAWPSCSRSST